MGLFGGDSSSSSTVNNYSSIDNSQRIQNTQTITYTDSGAIEAGKEVSLKAIDNNNSVIDKALTSALGFGEKALSSNSASMDKALTFMSDVSKNAMSVISNKDSPDQTNSNTQMVKYSAMAATAIGIAMVMRSKK